MTASHVLLSRVLQHHFKGSSAFEQLSQDIISPLEAVEEMLNLPREEAAKRVTPALHDLFLMVFDGDENVKHVLADVAARRRPLHNLELEIASIVEEDGPVVRQRVRSRLERRLVQKIRRRKCPTQHAL